MDIHFPSNKFRSYVSAAKGTLYVWDPPQNKDSSCVKTKKLQILTYSDTPITAVYYRFIAYVEETMVSALNGTIHQGAPNVKESTKFINSCKY